MKKFNVLHQNLLFNVGNGQHKNNHPSIKFPIFPNKVQCKTLTSFNSNKTPASLWMILTREIMELFFHGLLYLQSFPLHVIFCYFLIGFWGNFFTLICSVAIQFEKFMERASYPHVYWHRREENSRISLGLPCDKWNFSKTFWRDNPSWTFQMEQS